MRSSFGKIAGHRETENAIVRSTDGHPNSQNVQSVITDEMRIISPSSWDTNTTFEIEL